MAERQKLVDDRVEFFTTGGTNLDLILGGGWASGRIFNIVGDKSSGKTLLAIEAFANFTRKWPDGHMRYAESESAFDDRYAKILGFPDNVERPKNQLNTVEEFFNDLQEFYSTKKGPKLYILDSLDALSDTAEMERDINKGTYGASKPKLLSELFRRQVRAIEETGCTLGIISQIRDKIGVMFGETKTRSGGRALDFYASQVVWLAEAEKLKKQVRGEDKVIGVRVAANCKKLKVGLPFRKTEFKILFGYGIDDEVSMIDWLTDVKEFKKEKKTETTPAIDEGADLLDLLMTSRQRRDYPLLNDMHLQLKERTIKVWNEIEDKLAVPISKYNR